jgi:hypothetical protein
MIALDEFMERRNGIAHALNPGSSTGADQIIKDLDMLDALAASLCLTLQDLAPKPVSHEPAVVAPLPTEPDAAPEASSAEVVVVVEIPSASA